jgi:DNA-binding response OmpR family regulator
MANDKPCVLIVDDEKSICDVLHEELSERGYLCSEALDGNSALAKMENHVFQVVILDIRLPGISGMEMLKKINLHYSDVSTIIITAVNDARAAVEAMKLGAKDYIVKPFDLERVGNSVDNVLKNKPSYDNEISAEMEAIAFGVDAGQDLVDSHSKIVTRETINIARRLGIQREKVQKWLLLRKKLESDRDNVIRTALNKFQRSPFAQIILNCTEFHQYKTNSKELFN